MAVLVLQGSLMGQETPAKPTLAQGKPTPSKEPVSSLESPLVARTDATSPGPPLVMGRLITEFSADEETMRSRFRVRQSEEVAQLHMRLHGEWLERLKQLDFRSLPREDQIDYILLRNEIEHRQEVARNERGKIAESMKLVPYLPEMQRLMLARENVQPIPAHEIAAALQKIRELAEKLTEELNRSAKRSPTSKDPPTNNRPPASKDVASKDSSKDASKEAANKDGAIGGGATQAVHAAQLLRQSIRSMEEMHRFYQGYDPNYSWWNAKPFDETKQAMEKHAETVQRVLAGIDDKDKIVGQPIGQQALLEELRYAMIPYTPSQLVDIAEREFVWCDAEFKKAAEEMGLKGDWQKALERVKSLHAEPGDQPQLIRDLAWEAIHFLEANDLVTVPALAANGWRMEMMSPEAQRSNPYFLGGRNIIVSFPSESMSHQDKLMSLRSNNIHFARATVHHELIPGHHLQHYMTARYRPHRQLFDTPFWVEGWALYWEMLLWDLGFPRTPEDRVGMLFWRRHRCARIVFSLNYQQGQWSPERCVQYLIDRVGHEPSAAQAEVRRSVMGNYGPLYQAAYMLGGLQLRSLHRQLVQSGKMTNRAFHDAVIQQNSIPIEMIRAALTDLELTPDYRSTWRFAENP